MGVDNLWKLLSPSAHKVSLEELRTKRLAVDVSVWLHQVVRGVGVSDLPFNVQDYFDSNPDFDGNISSLADVERATLYNVYMMAMFHRICKLLFYGIRPVIVFDGKTPLIKQNTVNSRKREQRRQERKLQYVAKKLLKNQLHSSVIKQVMKNKDAKDDKKSGSNNGFPLSFSVQNNIHDDNNNNNDNIDDDNDTDNDDHSNDSDLMDESKNHRNNIDINQCEIESENNQLSAQGFFAENKTGQEIAILNSKFNLQSDICEKKQDYSREASDIIQKFSNTEGSINISELDLSVFRELPKPLQEEVIVQLKHSKRRKHGISLESLSKQDIHDFSQSQLKSFLDSSKISRTLTKMMNEESVDRLRVDDNATIILAGRLASDPNTKFLLYNSEESETILQNKRNQPNTDMTNNIKLEPISISDDDDDNVIHNLSNTDPDTVFLKDSSTNLDQSNHHNEVVESDVANGKGHGRGDGGDGGGGDDDDEYESIMYPSSETKLQSDEFTENNDEVVNPKSIMPDPSLLNDSNKVDDEWDVGEYPNYVSTDLFPASLFEANVQVDNTPINIQNINIDHEDKELQKAIELSLKEVSNHEPQVQQKEEQDIQLVLQKQPNVSSSFLEDESNQTKDKGKQKLKPSSRESLDLHDECAQKNGDDTVNETETSDSPAKHSETEMNEEDDVDSDCVDDTIEEEGRKEVIDMTDDDNNAVSSQEEIENSVIVNISSSDERYEKKTTTITDEKKNRQNNGDANMNQILKADGVLLPEEIPEEIVSQIEEERNTKLEAMYTTLENERQELLNSGNSLKQAVTFDRQLVEDVQMMLQIFGIPYIQSPYEADSQCGYLYMNNLVDGIITEDSDVFLFGADIVYRHVFSQAKMKNVEQYNSAEIKKELGLDRIQLIQLALLLGSDYTDGVHNVGIVTGIQIVDAFKGCVGLDCSESYESLDLVRKVIEPLKVFRDWVNDPKKPERPDPTCTERTKQFKYKYHGLKSRFVLPRGFPDVLIAEAYLKPIVDRSLENFVWSPVNIKLMHCFARNKMKWDEETVDKYLKPVLERQQMNKQQRIEHWISKERVAKIRSKRIINAVYSLTGRLQFSTNKEESSDQSPKEKNSKVKGEVLTKNGSFKRPRQHDGEKGVDQKSSKIQRNTKFMRKNGTI